MGLKEVLMARAATRRIICHLTALTFSAIVVAPITWMALDRDPPFDLKDGVTVPGTLRPGQPYKFSWLITPVKPRPCHGTVFWDIVDAQGIVWAVEPQHSLFTELSNFGPSRIVGRERILPNGIPDGELRLLSRMEFICNPVHKLFPIKRTFPEVKTKVAR